MAPRQAPLLAALTMSALLVGCSPVDALRGETEARAEEQAALAERPRTPAPAVKAPKVTRTPAPERTSTPTPTPTREAEPQIRIPADAVARLTIPQIGLEGLQVVPYEGSPDDGPGTEIQNRGLAASPRGSRGGVGPGELGNFIITAHRNSHGGPLHDLPDLDEGDRVTVRAGGWRLTYEITATRKVSFRSKSSLRAQRAAVPGKPGVEAEESYITISTCRTQEDHAEGNYWSDEFGNPEHRIDKVGVLVASRKA